MDPDALSQYPPVLKHSTLSEHIVYRRSPEFVALRGPSPPPGSGDPVLEVAGDHGDVVRVYRAAAGDAGALPAGGDAPTAVYALPSGRLGVPTGRVFVRFQDDVAAATRSGELKRAGYRIATAPAYAPNAAWLEAEDGEAATALRNIGRLETISGVVNVEPQLLAPRAAR